MIGGNPGEWHPRTVRAVLALVAKIEFLENGQGWELDKTWSVWRSEGELSLRRVGAEAWLVFSLASDLIAAWLEERPEFDHDDPIPEDLPGYPPGD